MRNLKRALSLALASVMLVGMMVVGTSAASYPDVDDNDNVEAIAVLQAVEVMQGDADTGNFRPDDEVSRNEMAVIMARLLLGPDADNYVGTHPFTDVPSWADKYVAACYNDGIIKGMDETTYGGKETVTAQQAAAMMLRALGYEKLEGTGADWARPVVQKANQISLFKDVGSNPNAAMTRNQIAQLGLNTLQATMVTTESGTNVNLGDLGSITTDVKYTEVLTKDSKFGKAIDGDNVMPTDGWTVQLGEHLYNGDLKKVTGDPDDFGRPADRAWTMKGVSGKVGNAAKEPVATFTGKTGAGDVASALSGYYVSYTDASHNVPVNDKDKVTSASIDGKITVSGETVAKAIADDTANGKVYEFFAGDDNVISDVVIITYKVGKVNNVRETSKGTTYSVDNGDGSGVVYNPDEDTDDTAVVMGDVAKDDIVTTVRANGVLYIYPTTTFEGVQSGRNATKNTITVDGKTYDVAVGVSNVSMSGTNFSNSKDSATFYVDQYGYVVKSEAVEDSSEYAVVDEIRYKNDGGIGSSKSVEARLVFTDGTSEIVNVTEINDVKVTDSKVVAVGMTKPGGSTYAIGDIGITGSNPVTLIVLPANVGENDNAGTATALSSKVVKYTKSGSDYKLTYGVTEGSGTVANKTVAEKGMPAFSYNTSYTATADKDTVYIIKTDDAKYSVYTGYQNVTKVVAGATAVNVAYSKDGDKVNVVYIDADVANATTGDTSNDIVYILDHEAYSEFKNDDGDKRYEYTAAVLNGDDSQPIISQSTFPGKGFYEVELNDDGEVKTIRTKDALPTNDTAKWAKVSVTKESDDTGLFYAGASKGIVCSDAKVYVVDDKTFYEGDGASADRGDTVFYKVKGTASGTAKDDITAEIVYIVKASSDSATVIAGDVTASDITNMFTQDGKDEITVTGGAIASPSVPANKKLTVDSVPTGTVTLAEGSTLKLDLATNKTSTDLPTLANGSKGTIELPAGVSTSKDTDDWSAITSDTNYTKASSAGTPAQVGDNGKVKAATGTVTRNGIAFQGEGHLTGFPSTSLSSAKALYKLVLTGAAQNDTITGGTWKGTDGSTGALEFGNGAKVDADLTLLLLLPANVTEVVLTVSSVSDATIVTTYTFTVTG